MLCQAKAFLAASANPGGTAFPASMACRSLIRSSSSSQPSAITAHLLSARCPRIVVGDTGRVRGPAQPVEAAGTHWTPSSVSRATAAILAERGASPVDTPPRSESGRHPAGGRRPLEGAGPIPGGPGGGHDQRVAGDVAGALVQRPEGGRGGQVGQRTGRDPVQPPRPAGQGGEAQPAERGPDH